ncbi:MAG: hypothetical protein AAFO75_09990, partial [Pseudomonadota bacterium]
MAVARPFDVPTGLRQPPDTRDEATTSPAPVRDGKAGPASLSSADANASHDPVSQHDLLAVLADGMGGHT